MGIFVLCCKSIYFSKSIYFVFYLFDGYNAMKRHRLYSPVLLRPFLHTRDITVDGQVLEKDTTPNSIRNSITASFERICQLFGRYSYFKTHYILWYLSVIHYTPTKSIYANKSDIPHPPIKIRPQKRLLKTRSIFFV